MEFNAEDIVGKVFFELRVLAYSGIKVSKNYFRYFYKCSCSCGGGVAEVERQNLLKNHTKSCGCLKKKIGQNNKDWKGFGEISGNYWGHITRSAKRRNIEFKITIEQAWVEFIVQNRLCALSGVSISMVSKTASLDRIDSNKGYEFGNFQWVHKDLNLMKMAMSQTKFVEWCSLVHSKQTRSGE